MLAAVITAFGGPDVFALDDVPDPVGGPVRIDPILIDVTLAGVDPGDLARRRGFGGPPLPAVLGADVVGRRRYDGRRVAALLGTGGGYARVAAAPARHVVEIPDEVGDAPALAVLGPGLTAWHCLHTLGRIDPDDVVVVTAAAGGVGHLAVQMARAAGARVIGLASTPMRREFARGMGAHATADSRHPDVGAALDEAPTLVLDGVGGRMFTQLRAVLAPFGRMVTYSGPVGAFTADEVRATSTGVLGFALPRLLDDEELYRSSASRLFHLVGRGLLNPRVGGVYPLSRVGRAHADLEDRVVSGRAVIDVRRLD
ncbi:quinone oxidoreductase family protein [Actinoplanes sp. G11-F43]|uniref:quinone oxidoreductase family protein n=1 Tax=Actinoplanes sp. G11-F43 TaxID=3424130 RepID=UPI003D3443A6